MSYAQFDVGSLLLRPYAQDDFEEFAAIFSDPETMQHAEGVMSIAQAASLFRSLTAEQSRTGEQAWAVMDRPTQGLAGHVALKRLPDGHEQELTIVLRARFRGKGNGTAIGRALLEIAFRDSQCAAVVATVGRKHEPALALARKLNFMPVAITRDARGEHILLKLMRDRWKVPAHKP